jgi:hypothetical protein
MIRTAIVQTACGISLALGLFFLFVWAPHPWGWEGFDHYHELALTLAAGQPFPTMEVPWGYAYFLAAFYRAFGDHPWIPLLVQVTLNATMPLLVFTLARTWWPPSTAALAALLTGIFSFNTIYASTQSSDAVCTVLFITAIVTFVRARRTDSPGAFALAGVLTGVATQFRPNLILIPAVLAGFALLERPPGRCAAAVRRPHAHALGRAQLPVDTHAAADQRAWRRAVVVRNAASRPLPPQPRL